MGGTGGLNVIVRVSLTVLLILLAAACSTPEGAYRRAYGPGPWDWDYRRGNFDRPGIDRMTLDRYGYATNYPVADIPVQNIGRPAPPSDDIPGLAPIPEIPDVPTVLPQ